MSRDVEIEGVLLRDVPDDVTDAELRRRVKNVGTKRLGQMIAEEEIFGGQPREQLRAGAIEELLAGQGVEATIDPGELTGAGATMARFDAARLPFEKVREQIDVVSEHLGLDPTKDFMVIQDPDNPASPSILVRNPDSGNFIELDQPGFTTVADFAEAVPQVVNLTTLGGIGGLLSAAKRGLTLRALMTSLGSYLGFKTESEIQRASGREQTTPSEANVQAALEAMFALGGEVVGEAAVGIGRTVSGTREVLPQEVFHATNIARRHGFPAPNPGDVSPTGQRMVARASQTHLRTHVRQIERLHGVLERLNKQVKELGDPTEVGTGTLRDFVNFYEKQMRDVAAAPIRVAPSEVSEAARNGILAYEGLRAELEDRLYNEIVDIATPVTRRRGARGRFAPAVRLQLGTLRTQARELLAGIRGQSRVSGQEFQELERVDPRLADLIRRFLRFPDELTTLHSGNQVFTTYDQIRSLERQAQAMADTHNEFQNGIVDRFLNILDDSLRSLRSDVPEFNQAVDRLNAARTERTTTLRALRARQLVQDLADRPERAGRLLITPDQPDRIRLIKKMYTEAGQEDKWFKVLDGWVGELMDDPTTINSQLDVWHRKAPEALRRMVTVDEEKWLRRYGTSAEKFYSQPLVKLAEVEDSLGDEAIDAILDGDQRLLSAVIARTGGKNTPLGRALRRGVFKRLLKDASKRSSLVTTIVDPTQFEENFRRLNDSGLLERVLTEQDMEVAQAADSLLALYAKSVDIGATFAGSETAGQATNIFKPWQIYGAFHRKAQNAIFGTIFTSPSLGRLMGHLSRQPRKITRMRRLGLVKPLTIALSVAVDQSEEDAKAIFGPEVDLERGGAVARPSVNFDPSQVGPDLKDAGLGFLELVPGVEVTPEHRLRRTEESP